MFQTTVLIWTFCLTKMRNVWTSVHFGWKRPMSDCYSSTAVTTATDINKTVKYNILAGTVHEC